MIMKEKRMLISITEYGDVFYCDDVINPKDWIEIRTQKKLMQMVKDAKAKKKYNYEGNEPINEVK